MIGNCYLLEDYEVEDMNDLINEVNYLAKKDVVDVENDGRVFTIFVNSETYENDCDYDGTILFLYGMKTALKIMEK